MANRVINRNTEFPDMRNETFPALPDGFKDTSWHNDMCPSFWNESRKLKIWIDSSDPEKREFPEDPRFMVQRTNEEGLGEGDALFESDDWSAILTFLQTQP